MLSRSHDAEFIKCTIYDTHMLEIHSGVVVRAHVYHLVFKHVSD